jgi:hypothetical protein
MLDLGASILCSLKGDGSELKDSLLLSLLLAISSNHLYLSDPLRERVSKICLEAVRSGNEVTQFWAIDLLSRTGAHRLLDKLQVMFACELQGVDKEEDL